MIQRTWQLLVLAAVLGTANLARAQVYYVVLDSAVAKSGDGSGATAKVKATRPARYASRMVTVMVGGKPTEILISEELSRVTACYEWDAGSDPPATYTCKTGVSGGFNARASIETLARAALANGDIDAMTFAAMLRVPPPALPTTSAAPASGASAPASLAAPAPPAASAALATGAGDGALPGEFDGAPLAAPPVAVP